MRIEFTHFKRTAIGLISAGVALFAAYQLFAWWSSRPTDSAFLAALRDAASRQADAMRVCVPIPSPQYPDEILVDRLDQSQRAYLVWTFDGVPAERFTDMPRSDGRQPGKFEIDAAARYLAEQRARVLAQFEVLVKAGFLSSTRTRYLRGGALYNATLYEPTLAGRQNMPAGNRGACFAAGTRDDFRIVESKPVGDTGAGIDGYAVRYTVAVSERRPWTQLADVQTAFPALEKQIGPTESIAMLVRGTRGWIEAQEWRQRVSGAQWRVESERALDKQLSELKLDSADHWLRWGQLVYIRYFAGELMSREPVPNATIVGMLDQWENQFHRHAACLRFPATAEGDQLDKNVEGEVALLELPGRPDRDQWQVERVRRRLEALVRVGLAERTDVPALIYAGFQPKESRGMAFPAAVYRKTAKMLSATTQQRDCIILGKLKFEVQSQEPVGPYEIVFHGIAAITEQTDIARELQAELPEVASALKEGLYLGGSITRGQSTAGVQVRVAAPFTIDPELALKHTQIRSTVVPALAAGSAAAPSPATPAPAAAAPANVPAPAKADWGAPKGAPKITWRQSTHGGHVLDEGLSVEHRGSGGSSRMVATKGYSDGKWYFELKLAIGPGNKRMGTWTNAGVAALGSGEETVHVSTGSSNENKKAALIVKWNDWDYFRSGMIIGIALDLEKRRMWYRIDGNWINGNPEIGSGGFELARFSTFYALVIPSGSKDQADRWTANFGHRPFAYPAPKEFRPYDS